MKLKEDVITDREEMEELLRKEKVCRFAMCDDRGPYVLPTAYGYRDGRLYLHSSREGRKIEALKRDPRVCFVVDTGYEMVPGSPGGPHRIAFRFKSVIGSGRARFVEDPEEKREAMDIIVEQQFGKAGFNYSGQGLENMAVIRVDLESLTGKRVGY
ncbi:pyridoxamine 5'-phosphate oxidase family protein [Methanomassiliicoccus luminyensis]|uniref:pyridoxamine 5'-phosphate oxidase family protein n=1 Tax=Methanomassiliicoccus luminyensis TaxID=1080712 RepID=UPI000374E036|nr:pyridoxamine 5'-phosphate oxidase family protein [Methanomassiliicoccus luminyensis]